MVKLKRVYEAFDSSHTSIMYNLSDILSRKGWDVKYSPSKGMMVSFTLDSSKDKNYKKFVTKWEKENPGMKIIPKGDGLSGWYYWDISKVSSGDRVLVTKDITVKGQSDLVSLSKKLKADATSVKDMKGTNKSPQLFKAPNPIPIVSTFGTTFLSLLKQTYTKIISDISLALSEIFIENSKSESKGSDVQEVVTWTSSDVQDNIAKEIKGIEIDKNKTTDKELIFKYKGKNGSLHINGYMLALDLDTDDNVPPTNYPIKDRNNLTLNNLLSSIKTVFSRRESKKEGYKGFPYAQMSEIEDSPMGDGTVYVDVAKERFLKQLQDSLILSDTCPESDEDMLCIVLSPSYAIKQLSDITVPIYLNGRMLKIPAVDTLPDPIYVFDGDYTEDPISDYNQVVQKYIDTDMPYADIMEINLDNASEAKVRVVDMINALSEDYQNKRSNLEISMDTEGEGVLTESRYYIVPSTINLSNMEAVKRLTPKGYTDLNIAKQTLIDMLDSGKYDVDLKILDTNYSSNKDKWNIL